MGMFDTLRIDPPLKCPVCSADVNEVQTHYFGDTLAVYRIGSVMTMSPVLTGIVKETFFCNTCLKEDPVRERERESLPLYIGIWHSVLVTVGFQLSEVERRLAAVDRLDLIGWLDQAHRKAQDWERRFNRLRSDVRLYNEHLRTPPQESLTEEDSGRVALRRLWGLPDDILKSHDPLGAILKRNEIPTAEEVGNDD